MAPAHAEFKIKPLHVPDQAVGDTAEDPFSAALEMRADDDAQMH